MSSPSFQRQLWFNNMDCSIGPIHHFLQCPHCPVLLELKNPQHSQPIDLNDASSSSNPGFSFVLPYGPHTTATWLQLVCIYIHFTFIRLTCRTEKLMHRTSCTLLHNNLSSSCVFQVTLWVRCSATPSVITWVFPPSAQQWSTPTASLSSPPTCWGFSSSSSCSFPSLTPPTTASPHQSAP